MHPVRSLLLATAGAVGSAAALVASPRAYGWLRARTGADAGGLRGAEAAPAPPDVVGGSSEARDALRARLARESPSGPSADPVVPREAAAADRRRAAIEETRSRARERAGRGFGDPRD